MNVKYKTQEHKQQSKLNYPLVNKTKSDGEIKKMVDLNEVAPIKPLFEGSEKIDKKEILDKKLIVDAYAVMDGEDSKFGVIRFTLDGESRTTTLSEMLLNRFEEGVDQVGIDEEKSGSKEKVLKDTIEVTIVEKQSEKNKNRNYYDFA
ncbi:MAG: hypothetical protein ACQERX_02170 [Bacillota bacterium]